jgi:toxin ParE1/3/4
MPVAIWNDQARQDLRSIGLYVGRKEDRPAVAARIMREIREMCDHYARHPLTGTSREEFGDGCRVFSHKRWVILFRPIDQGIEVLRIFDGSQDYESLFEL